MEANPSAVSVLPNNSAKPGVWYYFARIAAAIIDLMVIFIFFFLVGMAVAIRVGGTVGVGKFDLEGLPALAVIGITGFLGFAYYWLLEGFLGRTLGKMIFQLKVVREGGAPCGLLSSLIRNLLRVVDGFFGYMVGLVCILATEKQQRVGDMAAKTRVVKDSSLLLQTIGILVFLFGFVAVIWGIEKVPLKKDLHSDTNSQISSPSTPPVPSGSSLSLHELRFTEGKDGPPTVKKYGPGDDVFLSFEVHGVQVDPSGNASASLVFSPQDPQGRLLVDPIRVEAKGPSPTTPAVVPSSFHLTLPAYVEGGTFSVQIAVHDDVRGQDLSQKVPFEVSGPQIPPGVGFGIQNFQFLAEKNGPVVEDGTYSPGSTIYARFLAVGFRLGDQNAVKMRLDLSVLSPSGEKLLDENDLIKVDDTFPYPPRYLAMNTSVNIPSSASSGRYTLHYVLSDDVSGAQVSLDQPVNLR